MAFSKSKPLNKLVSKSKTLKKHKKLSGKKEPTKSKKLARKSGPRLPSSLLREIDKGKSNNLDSESNEEEGNDFYEYEEEIPEEESKKNRRYDPVENYEYEMPEDMEDEDVPSEEDEDAKSGESDGDDEEDGDKHLKMLEGITGIRGEAFQGEEKSQVVLSDLQGDSNNDKLSINDLLDPLYGKSDYGELRKSAQQLQKKPMTIMPPLPKAHREKSERKVAYEISKKEITKWEPLVKRNREAPVLFFQENVSLGVSTVGAIASEFEPKSEFEKKMTALVHDPKVSEAHRKDGAKLLELNKVSIEDVRERQNRLAKMRSLLFRHEMKAKHIKKIKSKTYHRILKKEKQKATSAGTEFDSDEAKDLAKKQEFKRAEERLTLKHKNNSKWAKRILKRGLQAQDEGTRAAITEQLNEHAILTRKMNSMNDSSDDESSDDDDASDDDILNRAKDKTLEAIEEDVEIPKDGVFGLPFMQRALEKQKAAAADEARIALQEYESSLGHLKNDDDEHSKSKILSGRKVFGGSKRKPEQPRKTYKSDDTRNSDSEDDADHIEPEDNTEMNIEAEDIKIGSSLIAEDLDLDQSSVFKNFTDIAKDPGPKTTYDVAVFASGSWKKAKDENKANKKTDAAAAAPAAEVKQDIKEIDQTHDSESEEELEVGTLSFGPKNGYELPSQADLIHDAFAGDDVEAEFEKDKMDILNEENPEPEKPTLVPGWGQWTNVQLKRGPPSWMIEEHEKAKRKRDEALKKRTDYKFKNVVITEKINKKAEKLMTKTLPFPYKSKDVYEQSIRMPLGPDFNPAISVGALNRPSVVKKAGVIIKPIKYEEVDPHGKEEEPKHSGNKAKTLKLKNAKGKHSKKKASK